MLYRTSIFILALSVLLLPSGALARDLPEGAGFYETLNKLGPPLNKSENEARREDTWYYKDKNLTFINGVLVHSSGNFSNAETVRPGRRRRVHAKLPDSTQKAIQPISIATTPSRPTAQQTPLREILQEIEKTVPSEAGPEDRTAVPSPRMDPRSGRGFSVVE